MKMHFTFDFCILPTEILKNENESHIIAAVLLGKVIYMGLLFLFGVKGATFSNPRKYWFCGI